MHASYRLTSIQSRDTREGDAEATGAGRHSQPGEHAEGHGMLDSRSTNSNLKGQQRAASHSRDHSFAANGTKTDLPEHSQAYLIPLQRNSQRVSNMDSIYNCEQRDRTSLEARNKELEARLNDLELVLRASQNNEQQPHEAAFDRAQEAEQ